MPVVKVNALVGCGQVKCVRACDLDSAQAHCCEKQFVGTFDHVLITVILVTSAVRRLVVVRRSAKVFDKLVVKAMRM